MLVFQLTGNILSNVYKYDIYILIPFIFECLNKLTKQEHYIANNMISHLRVSLEKKF